MNPQLMHRQATAGLSPAPERPQPLPLSGPSAAAAAPAPAPGVDRVLACSAPAPRRFCSTSMLPSYEGPSSQPHGGLPHDRASRIAARRAFVDLKKEFLAALSVLQGGHADWLRTQVRLSEEPSELWLLRAPVLAALNQRDERTRQWRQRLRKSLATLFPDSTDLLSTTAFGVFATA